MAEPVVFVVDDDADVRESLQTLLEASGFQVQTFDSAGSFLTNWALEGIACLIADIRMPDMDGLQLQEELVRRKAGLPVIIVTGHGDVPLAVRAMKAGAIDFLEKPFDDKLLLGSVGRALEAAKTAQNSAAEAQRAEARIAELTSREKQVLELLAAGRPNKVIAYELDISPRTVEIHRARVMEKMRAKSLAELVRVVVAARHS
ncbi:MAG TPA: response regulator FixJ [Rhizomicrobium sp.]|nr:response regulator FixJ [Rhizomicrobium sp.]